MKSAIKIYLLLCAVFFSCNSEQVVSLDSLPLVPYPNEIVNQNGSISIASLTSISFPKMKNSFEAEILEFWEKELKQPIQLSDEGVLSFALDENLDATESYSIQIGKDKVLVAAATEEGLYRGWQSLQQILVFSSSMKALPMGQIIDSPNYAYRGAMLDVARHFFTLEEVKRYVDLMALYKFNYLHLHLTDDQGWRIEIKSWPRLTEFSSQSEVGGTPGGYYTQDDYVELVQYAAQKFITIVPEFDVPGHTNAALHAYAELNCNGVAPEVHTGIEVGFSTLCVDKPITYQFVEDVIRELASLTPGPYIHIGGDETQATPDAQFMKFIDAVIPMVGKYNKTPMGWFEVQKTNYDGDLLSQYWAKEADKPEHVKKGKPIVMSPSSFAYLDMKYDSLSQHGLFWAGYISVKKAYEWSPRKLVPSLAPEDIIGMETPLWSETISDNSGIDYLAFPRLIGHSEIGWSLESRREWASYKKRLKQQLSWLKDKGVQAYESPLLKD